MFSRDVSLRLFSFPGKEIEHCPSCRDIITLQSWPSETQTQAVIQGKKERLSHQSSLTKPMH